jgi:beta-lactamase superfamily II metal-dependent hydrolase
MAAAKKNATRSRPAAKNTTRSSAKAGKAARQQPASPTPSPGPVRSQAAAPSGQNVKGLRVRMFRVGFGDFFLLTVPTSDGPKHILIDCGVHAKDLNSIRDAVEQMAKDCDSKLALIIMTHRHADHISGFATCSDLFGQFTVDRVWMPWFEDPANKTATAFQAGLTAMASRLSISLAARVDDASRQLADMAENITGGMAAAGGVSANQKALDVLHKGFLNTAEYNYYKAGDEPTLPKYLLDAGLSAQILGPPIDPALVSQMNYKTQQYLADNTEADDERLQPFPSAFFVDSKAYPADAFKFYKVDDIKKLVDGVQPDVLAAQAMAADKTLNNQSLVILFSFGGKNLLFAGDAQWGNWENFLYGGAFGTPGHTVITDKAKAILGKIDFYKVGHHGSTNATPKDAVAAMRLGCVGMCSTQIHAYNEVPREPLLQALGARMNGQLARSDQVATKDVPANADAGPLPNKFTDPTGTLFIDYEF